MSKKNFKIPVYKAEAEDGLVKQIQSNASIAYVTKLEDTHVSEQVVKDYLRTVSSSIDEDQFDLFYLTTILVSTVWNKNDDVFTKLPVWAARNTPVHKQFNLEHDQSKIIGHMTSARVINEDYSVIDDDTPVENLPDKFHILTGAVIYRALADEKAQENIERIIQEIHNGEWYVSMECLFRDFDYATISPDGKHAIVDRGEDTAWLTKHLRSYGGDGVWNGYKVGRALKNITFSGKGLVRRPANPDSIIFNENFINFKSVAADLGYLTKSTDLTYKTSSQESILMATDIEKELETLRQEKADLAQKVSEFESSATTAKINSLESDIQVKDQTIASLKDELNTVTVERDELSVKFKDAEIRATKAEETVNEYKANEITRSRIEKLVKMHAPEDEAKSIVAVFADKNDEQFDSVVGLFASKWKPVVASEEVVNVVDTPVKDKVEVEPDVNLTASHTEPEDDNSKVVREGLSKVFASMLNENSKKKLVKVNGE